jgi:hypothetical protein
MGQIKGFNIQEVTPTEACQIIEGFDNKLSAILKEWEPGKDFKLYKARYKYGTNILLQGKLQLPLSNGNTIDFNDCLVPVKLQQELSYSTFPIGIILNNSAEVFVELDSRIISLAIFERGIPLGLLETIESAHSYCFKNVWNVIAGSRTAFMLPKISDKFHHSRIQKALGCEQPPPRLPNEHFHNFVEIMNKTGDQQEWYVDLLFFTSKWFEPDYNNLYWLRFYNYLQSYFLQYTAFSCRKSSFDFTLALFSNILIKKRKKFHPQNFEKMKNLIVASLGIVPLFMPAINNDKAPVAAIQKIYREIYGLTYAPTIMVPYHFSFNQVSSDAYFSLKYHNTFEIHPKTAENESLITDLCEINSLLTEFQNMLKSNHLQLHGSTIEKILLSTDFDFYHIDSQDYKKIKNTKELPEHDIRLIKQLNNDSFLPFPHTAPFFRSCVKLHKNSSFHILREVSVIS